MTVQLAGYPKREAEEFLKELKAAAQTITFGQKFSVTVLMHGKKQPKLCAELNISSCTGQKGSDKCLNVYLNSKVKFIELPRYDVSIQSNAYRFRIHYTSSLPKEWTEKIIKPLEDRRKELIKHLHQQQKRYDNAKKAITVIAISFLAYLVLSRLNVIN